MVENKKTALALEAISQAVNNGSIEKKDAATLRTKLGITQAYFTRKQPNKAKAKVARKQQQASRKRNR